MGTRLPQTVVMPLLDARAVDAWSMHDGCRQVGTRLAESPKSTEKSNKVTGITPDASTNNAA